MKRTGGSRDGEVGGEGIKELEVPCWYCKEDKNATPVERDPVGTVSASNIK